MTLKDLFDALNAGELRLNSIGDDTGDENFNNKKKLLSLLRRSLTELHTRFDLRIKEAAVTTDPDVETYTLTSADYPSLLKIERLLVEEDGIFVVQPLNQKQNSRSYQAVNYRSVVLPKKLDTRPEQFIVEYREDHPVLEEAVLYELPTNVEIQVPQPFLEPIALYIAAKVHAGNGAADGIDLATGLLTQYEMACQKLEAFNMDNDQLEWRDVIYEEGWV